MKHIYSHTVDYIRDLKSKGKYSFRNNHYDHSLKLIWMKPMIQYKGNWSKIYRSVIDRWSYIGKAEVFLLSSNFHFPIESIIFATPNFKIIIPLEFVFWNLSFVCILDFVIWNLQRSGWGPSMEFMLNEVKCSGQAPLLSVL